MLFCAVALGCGASPRMLHQSEAYYERCHAADLDPARSTEDRLRCWTAWVEHYRVGMPPERVSHARRRLAALNDGIALEPLPDVTPSYTATFMALEAAESPEERVELGEQDEGAADEVVPSNGEASAASSVTTNPGVTNPGVTNPDVANPGVPTSTTAEEPSASPRPTAPGRDPSRIPDRPRPLAPRAASPTHPCTPVCQPRWDACVDRAMARGIDGLEACRIEHRVCMNGCM
jgi:hypothetical protein